jgi:hypothetical protein
MRRSIYFAAAGLMAGVGILTKGPYGLLFPLLFTILAAARRADWKFPRWGWLAFGLAMVVCIATWAVPVFLRDHGAYLHGMLTQPDLEMGEKIGRKPFYAYTWQVLLQTFPLSLFLPMAAIDWRRRGYSPSLAMAAGIFILLSIMPKKRSHYLLPLYPFLAIDTAASIVSRSKTSALVRRAGWTLILFSLAAIPFYFLVVQPIRFPGEDPELQFARQLLEKMEPGRAVYFVKCSEEPLAWLARRTDQIDRMRSGDSQFAQQVSKAKPGSYLVIAKRYLNEFLAQTGPLPRQVMLEEEVAGEPRVLFRLGDGGGKL